MRWKIGLAIVALSGVILSVGSPAGAQQASQSVTDHGLTVYYGVIPAAIAEGVVARHGEANMHGGPSSSGQHEQHLVVAIFNADTGERVTDAVVTAQVSALGHVLPEETLEPMKIADTITYGNLFDMSRPGVYRIRLSISGTKAIAAVKKPIVIDLLYDHPIPGHRPSALR